MSAILAALCIVQILGIYSFADEHKMHTWNVWTVVTPATRTSEGLKTRKCQGCDKVETQVIPKRSDPLKDIPDGKWYTTGVLYCYENGLMTGTGTDTFSPDGTFTRAMFVTVLSKIDKADTSTYTGTSFSDVKTGQWYSKPIEWAFKNGYTSGLGDGTFGVNNPVTREQLAVFLYNYTVKKGIKIKGAVSLSGYTDAGRVSSWAKNAVKWAVGNGLISGTSETTLSPGASATRAQIALIVKNYVEKILYVPEQTPNEDYELPFIPG